ncbi:MULTISPECIES: hypothetical protein [unclassified Microcoleus]
MSGKLRSLQTFKVHRATVRRWLQQIELSWVADRSRWAIELSWVAI